MGYWAEMIKRVVIVGAALACAAFLLWGMWLLIGMIIG